MKRYIASAQDAAARSAIDAVARGADAIGNVSRMQVPAALEREVVTRAWEKAHGERRVFQAINGGMGAREAWDQFGIL